MLSRDQWTIKFVTSHVLRNQQHVSHLQFWTYSFSNNDLFLEKSIEFDSPLSIVQGCAELTKFVYIQRSSERRELLLFNTEGELIDKID